MQSSIYYSHLSPNLVLWLTLSGSNYPCLEQIYVVPRMFELMRFHCFDNFLISSWNLLFLHEIYKQVLIIFLFLHKNMLWVLILEMPHRGAIYFQARVHSAVGSMTDYRSRGFKFKSQHNFHRDWTWNHFCSHFLLHEDSRWAVVSYWLKYVHKYWLTTERPTINPCPAA